jgi:hypothetical protein
MSRLHETLAGVRARPRPVVAATGAFLALAVGVAAVAAGRDDTGPDLAALDAARVAPVSSTTAPGPTVASTTTSTTTTTPPTTAPVPTDPPPVETTAAPPPSLPSLPQLPPLPAAAPGPAHAPGGARCLVRLHGKGGGGAPPSTRGDVVVLSPTGNADGWGARQWSYSSPADYGAARAAVAGELDAAGCAQVIVDGFSNGGGFAVKLYCRGESFGGRLVGVVADDPVPDHGADGCSPAAGVPLTIYWTGALAATAVPGWDCAQQDWTCDGATTVGIDAYAANAGATLRASPFHGHQWYADAPETTAWR